MPGAGWPEADAPTPYESANASAPIASTEVQVPQRAVPQKLVIQAKIQRLARSNHGLGRIQEDDKYLGSAGG